MRVLARAVLAAAAAAMALYAGTATACHDFHGKVKCQPNGDPIAGAVVIVERAGVEVGRATTNALGAFSLWLPSYGDFTARLDISGVGSGYVVSPGDAAAFSLTAEKDWAVVDWVVGGPVCQGEACWLTGGGAKFSPIAGMTVAERGPKVSFGGNVNPGCSPTAGQGGQWNHVDHGAKLHFQGFAVTVDRCGLVPGIPPGSTSPATPYNFIEFHGTGRLIGVANNATDLPEVCFEGRAEDRNEPGSSGARDGSLIDRYYLRVTDCEGTTLLLLEDPAQPGPSDPLPITDGNLQIHISSCP